MSKNPISPIGRVSYPHVFVAQVQDDGSKKFSLSLLFDKTADLTEMKKMAEEAARAKWPKGLPSGFRSPFRDGNEKDQPEYANTTYVSFRANENRRPQVIGPDKAAIVQDDGAFYAGCYARVSFSCYAYDTKGNRGVAFGLNNIQKVRDGDRLDGGSSADDDFDALEDAESSMMF